MSRTEWKFGSLFSGIEAASVAWLPLGWRCAWTAEIDPFACAVLRHRYPDTPNLGDVNRIEPDAVEPVDLVVFGSPCQSFSVAGKRLGLDDPRGNMALVGLRAVGRIRPRWVVWENVPGILSSDGGRDFGAFLGLLGELGYGFAYRVLDAQHAGVPQRRRRVFVVGYLGDWRGAAAVLFEPESLRGDPAPRREAGQAVAAGAGDGLAHCLKVPSHSAGWKGDGADNLIAAFGGNNTSGPIDVATACNAHGGPSGRMDFETETLIAFSAKDHGADAGDTAPTLRAGMHADGFDASEPRLREARVGTGRGTPLIACGRNGDIAATLQAAVGGNGNAGNGSEMIVVAQAMSVRRLTPRECERLQGFPDDFTLVPYRGKPAADGPRYRAVGNSMAVPVVKWIGQRIQAFEDAQAELADAAE